MTLRIGSYGFSHAVGRVLPRSTREASDLARVLGLPKDDKGLMTFPRLDSKGRDVGAIQVPYTQILGQYVDRDHFWGTVVKGRNWPFGVFNFRGTKSDPSIRTLPLQLSLDILEHCEPGAALTVRRAMEDEMGIPFSHIPFPEPPGLLFVFPEKRTGHRTDKGHREASFTLGVGRNKKSGFQPWSRVLDRKFPEEGYRPGSAWGFLTSKPISRSVEEWRPRKFDAELDSSIRCHDPIPLKKKVFLPWSRTYILDMLTDLLDDGEYRYNGDDEASDLEELKLEIFTRKLEKQG